MSFTQNEEAVSLARDRLLFPIFEDPDRSSDHERSLLWMSGLNEFPRIFRTTSRSVRCKSFSGPSASSSCLGAAWVSLPIPAMVLFYSLLLEEESSGDS